MLKAESKISSGRKMYSASSGGMSVKLITAVWKSLRPMPANCTIAPISTPSSSSSTVKGSGTRGKRCTSTRQMQPSSTLTERNRISPSLPLSSDASPPPPPLLLLLPLLPLLPAPLDHGAMLLLMFSADSPAPHQQHAAGAAAAGRESGKEKWGAAIDWRRPQAEDSKWITY